MPAPFTGALVGSLAGGWIGLIAAVLVGGLFGFILAALVVTYRVDQIIAGVVINLFVLGLTSYVSSQVYSEHRFLNNAPVFRAVDIPFLSDIPVIGPVLFQQNIFVYGMLIMVAIATYYLFHTKHGLHARAVGEHPQAADTLGINVYTVRYINVTIGGMAAGFGGAFLTLGLVGRFDDNMDQWTRLHRPRGDDFRALAPGRRADGGADLRFCRLVAAKDGAVANTDPVGVPGHGTLYRHDGGGRGFWSVAPAHRQRTASRISRNSPGLSALPDQPT